MSIDAKIRSVDETAEGYLLHLEPRWSKRDHTWSLCGQKQLTIINPTWKPEPGLEIWGNSGEILIETKPTRHYERKGYTRLVEKQEPQP